MTNLYLTAAVLAVAVLIGACSSAPKSTGLLEQTRSDFRIAQSDPKVATYAPLELKQAGDALAQADAAANNNDSDGKIDQLAYVAKQKIALTQEVVKRKTAEAEVTNAGQERDQVRLAQRTHEANIAKNSAEQAQLAAQVAQSEALAAQRQTQIAQDQASAAQRTTQDANARAMQLEAQLAEMAAKQTARGMVITLGDVLFGTDLARLNAEGMRTAQKLAKVLQENPRRTVLVEGFADSTGAAAYNQTLSERRAGAVQAALLELGVTRERIAIRGYGESYPIAANDTAPNRQLNRRVEIVLSDDTGKITNR
jgi:outer membrane protein OmpA-like peptidoglycan-associated protein